MLVVTASIATIGSMLLAAYAASVATLALYGNLTAASSNPRVQLFLLMSAGAGLLFGIIWPPFVVRAMFKLAMTSLNAAEEPQ